MSYNVSCGEVCRAMSRHDIVCLHGTTWGVSCNVSCHEDKFGDVVRKDQKGLHLCRGVLLVPLWTMKLTVVYNFVIVRQIL